MHYLLTALHENHILKKTIMLTKMIYPLSLREKISWRVQRILPEANGTNIPLEFSKDIRLDLSKTDVGHRSIIYNGFYELDLSKMMVRLARQGGLMVDVGANYGYFSCLWASKRPGNSVIAFEASPVNIEPLRNNVRKNKLDDSITVIPLALGKEPGILKFNLATENKQTGWGGFTINNDSGSVEVKVDTLDNYARKNNIQKIDVLKIDVEGADTWVLYGAKELLSEKRIRHIFFEQNIPRMDLLNIKRNEAGDFLRELGYVLQEKTPNEFYAYPGK